MKPKQSPPADTSRVIAARHTGSIPKGSSNKVFFTHHSVEFVMGTAKHNEIAKVHCNGKEHLIEEVWQCSHQGHLMCRKCCFPSNLIIPEVCPDHNTPVFLDKSTGRSVRCQQVTCPANKTFNATCSWSGPYNEVIGHLDDCTFIPGFARVTMYKAALKAAEQRAEQRAEQMAEQMAEQKYEEFKQETVHRIHRIQQETDQKYKAMVQYSKQMNSDLTQKYNELVNLLKNPPWQLTEQPLTTPPSAAAPSAAAPSAAAPLAAAPLAAALTASAATTIEEEIPPFYNGELTWRITDFSLKLERAKTDTKHRYLESCPFYTSVGGYKMRVKLYPNGDGPGKGTHISIFFQIMDGVYDALLDWPFINKVTFMLLDHDRREHVYDAFRPDPKSCSFQRPWLKPNLPSGCPLFMPLGNLKNHAYIRDDALFVKVIVEQN